MVGPAQEELRLESERETVVRGAEGVRVESKDFTVTSRDDIDIGTVSPSLYAAV